MLAYYMDHHVHEAITSGLRRRGIDVLTAFEDGMASVRDEILLERAVVLERIVFTQDQDFLGIAARWQATSREFPGVVYAIQQDLNIGHAIEYLELVALLKTADEMRNHVEYLPAK